MASFRPSGIVTYPSIAATASSAPSPFASSHCFACAAVSSGFPPDRTVTVFASSARRLNPRGTRGCRSKRQQTTWAAAKPASSMQSCMPAIVSRFHASSAPTLCRGVQLNLSRSSQARWESSSRWSSDCPYHCQWVNLPTVKIAPPTRIAPAIQLHTVTKAESRDDESQPASIQPDRIGMDRFRSLARHIRFEHVVAIARWNWREPGRAGGHGHGSLLLMYRRERAVETPL